MRASWVLMFLFALSVGSLAVADAQVPQGYERLPHVADRVLLGQWNMPDWCTGAIIAGKSKVYWAVVCVINTGCCNGIFGYVLQRRGEHVFFDGANKITYTIQANGTLRVVRAGAAPQVLQPWSEHSTGPTWTKLEDWQIE